MKIGCHVSIAGGINKAPERAADFGCEIMQIFTRSPQGGKAPELTPGLIKDFKLQNKKYKIRNVYIHTPYYINFASKNNRIRYGSVSIIRDELERADLIGAKYVMTHLGSAKDFGKKESLKKTIEMLKKALAGYSGKSKLLLENSAGAGEIIGGSLSELGEIIRGVDSPTVAGVCLDTQHSFASGYNWTDFEGTLNKIDKELGLEKIKLLHANDSLTECGSNKDRHAHIGKGKIGSRAFSKIVAFTKKNNIDIILETSHPEVKEDIISLKTLRD